MPILKTDPEQNPSCHNSSRAGRLAAGRSVGGMAHATPGQGRGGGKTAAEISALAWRAARLPRPPVRQSASRPLRPGGRAGKRAAAVNHARCAGSVEFAAARTRVVDQDIGKRRR